MPNPTKSRALRLGLVAAVATPVALGALVPASQAQRKSSSKVVKIGFIAPLSGDLSALGIGMRNSVDLAIKQANASKKLKGWTIQLDAQDDQAKADVGAQVAAKLASDKAVAAVVGTLNSSVAQQTQPVLNKANIAQVSPANTNPTLTQGADFATAKKRPFPNYFRVSTTDAIQGPFGAQFMFKNLKLTNVATIHDQKTYGKGLVDEFSKEFLKRGGKIVATEVVNPDDKDFSAVIAKVKAANPQAVYYGGEYPAASLLTAQMKAAGVNIPLMGGDGVYSGVYIDTAKAAAEGDYVTSVGAPTETQATAQAFVAAYNKAYKEPYEAYGAYSFDAANVIIAALNSVLPKAKSVEAARPQILAAIGKTNITGATGAISFDEFGDTTNKVLTVYKVTGGKWVPSVTDKFE